MEAERLEDENGQSWRDRYWWAMNMLTKTQSQLAQCQSEYADFVMARFDWCTKIVDAAELRNKVFQLRISSNKK